jgi:hypothetical protein
MTDTMTFQNIVLSSWDTLYTVNVIVCNETKIKKKVLFIFLCFLQQRAIASVYGVNL